MSRMIFGLRGRLVLAQLVVFGALLLLTGIIRYAWQERIFTAEVDTELQRSGRQLREMLQTDLPQFGGDARRATVHVVSRTVFSDRALLAVDPTGTRLAGGTESSDAPSVRALDPLLRADVPVTIRLSGVDVRVLRVPLQGGISVLVAHSLRLLETRLDSYLTIVVFTTIAILSIAAILFWWASRAVLRPVTSIARAAAELGDNIRAGATSFGRLARVPGTDEVATLTKDFNRLLGALETALFQERRTANRFRQFLADAAHELRTPIAIIRAEAESAQADLAPYAQQAALVAVAAEAAHLGAIVNDLMMLARRDAGGRSPRSRIFLDDLAASAVARLGSHPLAEGRQLRLGDFEAAPVLADGESLERALVILVHNALVHAAPSPVEVSTGVHFTSIGARSWVRVRDWGPGIPTLQQDRIFDRFARLDHSRPGTGLGLPIARAIAEEFDGTLTVESEDGIGTRFLLELPCADDIPSDASLPHANATPMIAPREGQ